MERLLKGCARLDSNCLIAERDKRVKHYVDKRVRATRTHLLNGLMKNRGLYIGKKE